MVEWCKHSNSKFQSNAGSIVYHLWFMIYDLWFMIYAAIPGLMCYSCSYSYSSLPLLSLTLTTVGIITHCYSFPLPYSLPSIHQTNTIISFGRSSAPATWLHHHYHHRYLLSLLYHLVHRTYCTLHTLVTAHTAHTAQVTMTGLIMRRVIRWLDLVSDRLVVSSRPSVHPSIRPSSSQSSVEKWRSESWE